MIDKQKIAKNTMFLYIRMVFTMAVSLYTSRVILNTLGVEDFGTYNIVGGVVVLFSFINHAMIAATQRFLNFEMTKNSEERVRSVFSVSMNAHIIIIGIIVIFSETVGLWFLNNKLNIPIGRMHAANIVYQFSILTFSINILKVPYNASVMAYEKMSFYAWMSILETFLKLLIVIILVFFLIDKLILYSILTFFVSIVILLAYHYFCRKMFYACHYKFINDKALFRELLSFSGWSMFGKIALIGSNQGISMIMNIFLGVTVNAALGIADQVNTAIFSFVSNFQIAFNPQITQSYASGNISNHRDLLFQASRFSYYLLLILALPVLFNTDYILLKWLKIVPTYAVEFTQLIIIFSLIEALTGPFWVSLNATGKIKVYQISVFCILLLNLPIAYFILYHGFSPIYVIIVKVIINFILFVFRLVLVQRYISVKLFNIFKDVYLQVIIVSILATTIIYQIKKYFFSENINFLSLIIFCVISLFITLTLIIVVGLNRREKINIFEIIKNRKLK